MPVFTRSALFGVVLPALVALVPLHAAASDKGNPEAKRIVAVGGTITEILYALGAGERVIAPLRASSCRTVPESTSTA